MFIKLSSFSSVLRLSLCLLLSGVIHAGLFYPGWRANSADVRRENTPVAVTLLPETFFSVSADHETSALAQPLARTPDDMPAATKAPARLRATVANNIVTEPKPQPNQSRPEPDLKNVACAEVTVSSCEPSPVGLEDPSANISEVPRSQSERRDEASGEKAPEFERAQLHPTRGEAQGPAGGDLVAATPYSLNNPLPEYPYIARQRHWEGVVWLLVDVTAEGLVEDLAIERSCGHRLLDRSARRAVKRWRFSPALRAGLPVSSQVRIPVRFRLEDS